MMTKWEYVTGAVGGHDENEKGQDGWELVAVSDGIAFYKRPLEDQPVEQPVVAELPAPLALTTPEPEPEQPSDMPSDVPVTSQSEPQGFGVEPAETSDAMAAV